MVDVFDLLLLSRVPGLGPGRLLALVAEYREPRRVLGASARELSARCALPRDVASAVARFRKSPELEAARRFAERQLSVANRHGCAILSFWDHRYPDLLKRIADPPPVLFLKGTLAEADASSVAVVGTRTPSPYGLSMAARFAHELAAAGITVTSGLARGIDTAAHAAALAAPGRTIAVTGSGIDVCYPPENAALALRIARQGALLSECPMGSRPEAVNFPRRNRIISGLTIGTIVVESPPAGGAMITARCALDQNREVFAVPAAVTPGRNHGTNQLIREGAAKLVETLDDVLEELAARLRPPAPPGPVPAALAPEEQAVYDALGEAPDTLARIARRAGVTAAAALAGLERLVQRRLVRHAPGAMFARRR